MPGGQTLEPDSHWHWQMEESTPKVEHDSVLKTKSRISLSSVDKNNIGTLRKLLSVILPVTYTERFYADVLLADAEAYCKLIYCNDIPVGAVCSRIETDGSTKESKLYIMTMGILAPYRSLGLGTFAIKQILETASAPTAKPRLSSIYLHVQVSNSDAKRFYECSGFKEVGVVENYYKKIEPKAAWLMEWENPPLPPSTVVENTEKPAAKSDEKPAGKAQGKGKKGKGR